MITVKKYTFEDIYFYWYWLHSVRAECDTQESISMEEGRKRDESKKLEEEKRDGKIKEGSKESESKFSTWGI